MKRSFLWIGLLLSTAVLQQCTTGDGEHAGPQKVQFTFSYKRSDAAGGRVQQDAVPDALLLSLNGAGGTPVFTGRRIGLLHVGDSYITEPVEMTPGTYSITDFMLVAGDSVLYLTPFEGSPLSQVVNHPLPYPLVVNKDLSTTIDMDVIAVGTNPPEDFGYASFGINTMNPFRISVFTETTNLTNATAYILKGQDTLRVQHLDASINFLSFPGDAGGLHKLIVTKPGYAAFIKPFHYDELVASLHGLPLKVMLEPGLFTFHPTSATWSMTLIGMPGILNVDWGDGTRDLVTLGQNTPVTHTYAYPACCPASVTGDIDKIVEVMIDSQVDFDSINVQGVSRLGHLQMEGIQGPSTIDLSHNVNLFAIITPRVSRLKRVILPPTSLYQSYFIDITGPNQIGTADIDNLIEQVYTQTDFSYGGSFTLPAQSFSNQFVGPPSPAGMDMLRVLRDVHHTYIFPDPN